MKNILPATATTTPPPPPSTILWNTIKKVAPHTTEHKYSTVFSTTCTEGVCALCGEHTRVSDTQNFVSTKFTGWEFNTEKTSDDETARWCEPCVWCFTGENNRTATHILRRTPHRQPRTLEADNTEDSTPGYEEKVVGTVAGFPAVEDATLAVTETMSTPFPEHTYVSFPLSGKKHTLPYMRPGCVSTDTGVFRWGRTEAQMWENMYTYAVAVGLPTTFSQLFTQPPSTHGSMTTEQVQTFYRLYEELLLGRQNSFQQTIFLMVKNLLRGKPLLVVQY